MPKKQATYLFETTPVGCHHFGVAQHEFFPKLIYQSKERCGPKPSTRNLWVIANRGIQLYLDIERKVP